MASIKQLKSELKALSAEYARLATLPPAERAALGRQLNQRKQALQSALAEAESAAAAAEVVPLDISAPCAPDCNYRPLALGSRHPLLTELDRIMDIYSNMGFDVLESVQLDDEFHMFDSLNFPPAHPARDGYDTFRTAENFIAPAHTSTMQHRALLQYRDNLQAGGQIAVVIPGRVFRNEDADATHEHTFYQCEGVFVSPDANMGQLFGVLRRFFELYYGESLNIRTQPGFFPFTEPSAEFLIEKPAALCRASSAASAPDSDSAAPAPSWLEMGGCGMIHPRVLELAGIDPARYHGFAWGCGVDRLVMLKYHLPDVRLFESARLDFLEDFA